MFGFSLDAFASFTMPYRPATSIGVLMIYIHMRATLYRDTPIGLELLMARTEGSWTLLALVYNRPEEGYLPRQGIVRMQSR